MRAVSREHHVTVGQNFQAMDNLFDGVSQNILLLFNKAVQQVMPYLLDIGIMNSLIPRTIWTNGSENLMSTLIDATGSKKC